MMTKTILLVDDDSLVLELYRKKLVAGGYEVHTATDGLAAIKLLGEMVPDFIVLDLMMPRLSGADVMKFIRSKPSLARVPVAVWTNAFMSEQARQVNALGISRAIVKGDYTPAKLLELANEMTSDKPDSAPTADAQSPDAALPAPRSPEVEAFRVGFLKKVAAEYETLRTLTEEFGRDSALASRTGTLSDLGQRVHRLSGSAGLAGLPYLARLSNALEALLVELTDKPQLINASTTRTVTNAVTLLGDLIQRAPTERYSDPKLGTVLTVDDDPTSNEVVLSALRRVGITAEAVTHPNAALHLATQEQFDLALLDVELPQLNGFELTRKLRELPGHANLPVVYITSYVDFEHRAKAAGTTDGDWIIKPILPIELAMKALSHLIRARFASPAAPAANP